MRRVPDGLSFVLVMVVFLGLVVTDGHGESIEKLKALASAGSIHEDAPVKAHVQIEIAAPPAVVWALLIDAASWPNWQTDIEKVGAPGPLAKGVRFTWHAGGTTIHAQVQLFEPEQRLAWTGTAVTAKAIHLWQLAPQPGGHTLVVVDESMDGPLMSTIFPSEKLVASDADWLTALKKAAEKNR